MKPIEAHKTVSNLCLAALQRGLIGDFRTAANVQACLDLLGALAESAELPAPQHAKPANGFLSPSINTHETDKRD